MLAMQDIEHARTMPSQMKTPATKVKEGYSPPSWPLILPGGGLCTTSCGDGGGGERVITGGGGGEGELKGDGGGDFLRV